MTMQVADDDASVVSELLRVASAMRSELLDRDVYREQLVDRVDKPWGYREAATESHDQRRRPRSRRRPRRDRRASGRVC